MTADPTRVRYVQKHPRLAARNLRVCVKRRDDLAAGIGKPDHDADTVEHRQSLVRRWIEAFRDAGHCKRCGQALDGEGREAELARARGVGATCWERLTDADRDAITAWIDRSNTGRDAADLEEPS